MFAEISPEKLKQIAEFIQQFSLVLSLFVWVWFLRYSQKHSFTRQNIFQHTPIHGEMLPIFAILAGIFWLGAGFCYWAIWTAMNQGDVTQIRDMTVLEKLIHFNAISFSQLIALSGLVVVGFVSKDLSPQACGFKKLPFAEISKSSLIAFLLALLPVGMTLILTQSIRNEENMHEMFQIMQSHPDPLSYFLIGMMVIVFAPLIEELLFRVCLQGWLQQINPAAGIICTALIFALVHGWPDSIALIPLALILGVLYYWKRSFLTNVLTHAFFNAFNFVLGVMSL